MFAHQMRGYGYPVLAEWPEPWYETGQWQMYELKLCPDGRLKWYPSFTEWRSGQCRAVTKDDFTQAIKEAQLNNVEHFNNIATLNLRSDEIHSIELKVNKALQAKERLAFEEIMMEQEAIRRATNTPRIQKHELELPVKSEKFRDSLYQQLCNWPYLKIALVKHDNCKELICSAFGYKWINCDILGSRGYKVTARAKIADSSGLNHHEHWGKIKASIRKLLLPRANQLLQLASVQRLLAEAELHGQKVLVCGSYVFWYETEGQLGWTIKETDYLDREHKTGITLWHEGTILSKNHGRIIVLPYIKENGEHVQGHTKNAPHDGRAIPRHRDQYVNLPFKVLNSDLMIGLFGELPYE